VESGALTETLTAAEDLLPNNFDRGDAIG
jgi:hypothetical protein